MCVLQRETGGERWCGWGKRGNRKMSGGVNTETGVWQGTVIRFINHPMLLSLLGDCRKTLTTNWSSRCPTAETLFLPSPSLHSQFTSLLLLSVTSSLSPFLLGAIRLSSSYLTEMDWPWKYPFCFHHPLCIFTSPGWGVSCFSSLSHNIIGWHTAFNIFCSRRGTGHIRDESFKVITLACALPRDHFSSFERVCPTANTIDSLSAS